MQDGKIMGLDSHLHESIIDTATYLDIGAFELSLILWADWPKIDRLLSNGEYNLLGKDEIIIKRAEELARIYADMLYYVDITPSQASFWARCHIPGLNGVPLDLMKDEEGLFMIREYLKGVVGDQ